MMAVMDLAVSQGVVRDGAGSREASLGVGHMVLVAATGAQRLQ